MKYVFLICILFCVTTFSHINAIEFTDCGSKIGKFSRVDVSDCDQTKTYCALKRGTNATISIDFELVSEDSCSAVTTVVHGIIMDVPWPFPLQNPDGCVNSGITCPIEKGSSYKYEATLSVLKKYPKVTVKVKWELLNERKEAIVCVLIPAKIE